MTTGIFCPIHKEVELELLSTTSEWCYYCKECDSRWAKGKHLIKKPSE